MWEMARPLTMRSCASAAMSTQNGNGTGRKTGGGMNVLSAASGTIIRMIAPANIDQ